jgi:hypothetical protein
LNQLHQDSPGAPGVKEGDLVAPSPRTGFLVDEFDAFLPEAGENEGDVGDTVGDVVEGRALALEEAAHRGVGIQRLQELDRTDELHPDSLALQDFLRRGLVSAQQMEETARLMQGRYGDGDVVQRVGR